MPKALLLSVLGLLIGLAAESRGAVVDTVVRYVNGEVITHGDLAERVREVEERLREQGIRPEATMERRQALMGRALVEATADLLLEQEAIRMKIPVNTRVLKREIQQENDETGRWPTLALQRAELERRERQQRIQMLENFFVSRLPDISPEELVQAYEVNADHLRQPPQARVWRILLLPGDEDEAEQLAERMVPVCFEGLGGSEHAALKGLVTDELRSAYVAADGAAEVLGLLGPVLAQAKDAAPADPDPATAVLLERIDEVVTSWRRAETPAALRQRLEGLARRLNSLPDAGDRVAVFSQAASEMSMVPDEAAAGGDLGVHEPGQLGEVFDARVFAMTEGEVSPVFEAGTALCLLMVTEVSEGRLPTLDEARARLREALEQKQRETARNVLVAQLQRKAVIRDVHQVDLDDMLGRAVDRAAGD